MPSQRDPKKVFIGGYVSRRLKREFKRLAEKEAGGDGVRFMTQLIREGLAKRGLIVDDDTENPQQSGKGSRLRD